MSSTLSIHTQKRLTYLLYVTITGDKITDKITNRWSYTRNIEVYKDLTNMKFESYYGPDRWTPTYIRCAAPGVRCGDVTSVNYLALMGDDLASQYSLADLREAIQILGVSQSLYLCIDSLPDSMGRQEWLELAEKASRMELCMIFSNNDDEKTVKNLRKACHKNFVLIATFQDQNHISSL